MVIPMWSSLFFFPPPLFFVSMLLGEGPLPHGGDAPHGHSSSFLHLPRVGGKTPSFLASHGWTRSLILPPFSGILLLSTPLQIRNKRPPSPELAEKISRSPPFFFFPPPPIYDPESWASYETVFGPFSSPLPPPFFFWTKTHRWHNIARAPSFFPLSQIRVQKSPEDGLPPPLSFR